MPKPEVTIRDLTQEEMEELLGRHNVGRLAFGTPDNVDIEPIHYAFEDGALYGRTSPGTKLIVLAGHPWVAFEVDEVSGPFDWRSVVLKGTIYLVEPGEAPQLRAAFEHALRTIRKVMPEAFTRDDPTPGRSILFRLAIREMRGRLAATGTRGEPSAR